MQPVRQTTRASSRTAALHHDAEVNGGYRQQFAVRCSIEILRCATKFATHCRAVDRSSR
jgi:hypothetical protein